MIAPKVRSVTTPVVALKVLMRPSVVDRPSSIVDRRERWHAARYLVILLGVGGAAFERGSPPATASIEEALALWTT
jgi:hypothetical protein